MKKAILLSAIILLTSFQTKKYVNTEKTYTIKITETQLSNLKYYLLKSVPPQGMTTEQINTVLNPIFAALPDSTVKK